MTVSKAFQKWKDNPPKNIKEPELEKFIKCKKCKSLFKPSLGHNCSKN